jgi:transposase
MEFREKIAGLEKLLLAYENANTPPSKSRKQRKPREKTGNPRGAPVGHEGTTRETPEPNRVVDVEPLERCGKCKALLDEPDNFLERLITELLIRPEFLVTLFRLPVHKCKKCGAENIASHPECPGKGLFGYNIMALVAMLKHKARLPYAKVSSVLKNIFQLEIPPATALELDSRTATKLSPEYEKLKASMRKSNHSYTDETSANVNGERHNTWVFTNENVTLLVTRKSRGKKVLEEILGKDYLGCIICDGHKAYANFTSFIQRCWAHLSREAKHLAEDLPEALPLYRELKQLYEWGVERYRKRMSKKQRYSMWVYARHRLRKILSRYAGIKSLEKILGKIRNGFNHWFTFILHPEIEPTNNRAERGIRETVVQRKIYGCLRNEKGTHNHDVLTSLIATWQQRGLNPYTQMQQALRS